jgi:hypothetical protein
MRLGPGLEPESEPVAATPENLEKLEVWVKRVQVEPWTNPLDAVQFAMRIAPDAVYLLTDGEFTDRGRTVRFLQNHAAARPKTDPPRTVFHCVGFHSREGEPALKIIAQQNGGSYRFILPPKVVLRQPR